MLIGVPKEIKKHEYRIGVTPAMVCAFVARGHEVMIESGAGAMIGYSDEVFEEAGAIIVEGPKEIFEAEMVIKVKELQPAEFSLLKKGQTLFCYLHLAPDPIQAKALIESGVIAIAYDTVTDKEGRLPLLEPMSEIAGRIAVQVGAQALQMNNGGRGILLGGVPGVLPAKVMIVGGGAAGTEAARMALGLGADVVILDTNLSRLRRLDALYGHQLCTLYSTPFVIEEMVRDADLVIGAVLVHGKLTPKIITRKMVAAMTPGSAIVDISIDQGGCCETSRPTTHDDPIYKVDGVIHYCVANMPSACARTSTQALTNATMAYALKIADQGVKKALMEDSSLRCGLNVCKGEVTCEPVAADLGYDYVAADKVIPYI